MILCCTRGSIESAKNKKFDSGNIYSHRRAVALQVRSLAVDNPYSTLPTASAKAPSIDVGLLCVVVRFGWDRIELDRVGSVYIVTFCLNTPRTWARL